MNIPCLPTETSFDVQCPVCGRGFLLLAEPTLVLQRGSMRRAARIALAAHHNDTPQASGAVHPDEVFDLTGWDGEPENGSAAWDAGSGFPLGFTC
jgi:hypothetical protein